jgi:prepilin-type N-terminal cleavage/methylation domain-containing protein/prepilin-type processing-associated H-X9-DG protein
VGSSKKERGGDAAQALILIDEVTMKRKAFTLIELLVVIAIIAILAAILFPVFAQAKLSAKKAVALSNTKQIALGVAMYNTDYDDVMPVAMANNGPINGGGWGEWPIDMQLAPYIKNNDLWASPADDTTPYSWVGLWIFTDGALYNGGKMKKRSYNYTGSLATIECRDKGTCLSGGDGADPNTGMSQWGSNAHSATAMDEVANTIAIPEVWNDTGGFGAYGGNWMMGVAWGSYFTNCDVWKLSGRKITPPGGTPAPADDLPGAWSGGGGCDWAEQNTPSHGYMNQANYAYVDGHAKSQTWGAIRKNDFASFKRTKSAVTYNP